MTLCQETVTLLLEAPHLVAAALKVALDGFLAREMACADGDHHRARLPHSTFDPLAPAEISAGEERRLEFGRALQVAVEGLADVVDIACQPGFEHAVELRAHRLRVLDRAFEQLSLRAFRQAVEEGELLLVGFELIDGLA